MSHKRVQITLPKFENKMTVRQYAIKLNSTRPLKSRVGVGVKEVGMYSFKVSQLFTITSEEDKFWQESVDELVKNFQTKIEMEGEEEDAFPGYIVVRLELTKSGCENEIIRLTSGSSEMVNDLQELGTVLQRDLKKIRTKSKPATFGKLWHATVYLDYMSEKDIAPGYTFINKD